MGWLSKVFNPVSAVTSSKIGDPFQATQKTFDPIQKGLGTLYDFTKQSAGAVGRNPAGIFIDPIVGENILGLGQSLISPTGNWSQATWDDMAKHANSAKEMDTLHQMNGVNKVADVVAPLIAGYYAAGSSMFGPSGGLGATSGAPGWVSAEGGSGYLGGLAADASELSGVAGAGAGAIAGDAVGSTANPAIQQIIINGTKAGLTNAQIGGAVAAAGAGAGAVASSGTSGNPSNSSSGTPNSATDPNIPQVNVTGVRPPPTTLPSWVTPTVLVGLGVLGGSALGSSGAGSSINPDEMPTYDTPGLNADADATAQNAVDKAPDLWGGDYAADYSSAARQDFLKKAAESLIKSQLSKSTGSSGGPTGAASGYGGSGMGGGSYGGGLSQAQGMVPQVMQPPMQIAGATQPNFAFTPFQALSKGVEDEGSKDLQKRIAQTLLQQG